MGPGTQEELFEIVRVNRAISLIPSDLADLRSGVRFHLNRWLLSYDPELEGFPLSYSKLHIVGTKGTLTYQTPRIYIRVQMEVLVFRPRIGSILDGVVKKVSFDHVSALIFDYFHVVIPITSLPDGRQFDESWNAYYMDPSVLPKDLQWVSSSSPAENEEEEEEEPQDDDGEREPTVAEEKGETGEGTAQGNFDDGYLWVSEGSTIRFRIVEMDLSGSIVRLVGSMREEVEQTWSDSEIEAQSSKPSQSVPVESDDIDVTKDDEESESKEQKFKREKGDEDNDNDNQNTNGDRKEEKVEEEEEENDVDKKRKKKRRSRHEKASSDRKERKKRKKS